MRVFTSLILAWLIFTNQPLAFAENIGPAYVQVEKISVSPFALDPKNGKNQAEITIDFLSETRLGNGTDDALGVSCVSNMQPFAGDTIDGNLVSLGANKYRKICSVKLASNHPAEIMQIGLQGLYGEVCFIPSTDQVVFPINATDSFGASTKKYVELSRKVIYSCGIPRWSIPIAVSPPSTYTLPTTNPDGSVQIFKVDPVASKAVVSINTKKRNFTFTCPRPSTNFKNAQYRGYALTNDIAFGLSKDLTNTIPYGTKTFLGKKVTIYCTTLATYNSNFFAPVGYLETKPITIQIPSK